jgi:hypothetical protein
MEPEPIFGHPNEFNAVYLGQLLWEPRTDADGSLADWAKLRYDPQSSAGVALALRKTEAITQKTFFTLGHTVINYHNMIASVSSADYNLWAHALSKWDPRKRDLSESFFSPTDELIERCKAEKREAALLTSECLALIHNERKHLAGTEYERLRYFFEKLRDTAELWSLLVELYLLHRQIAFSPPNPDLLKRAVSRDGKANLAGLLAVAGAAMQKALEMEHRHGKNSWPVVSPNRGVSGEITGQVSVYQFVHEILRHYIAALTGEPPTEKVNFKIMDTVVTVPEVRPGSTESFWRQFVEWGRPEFQYEDTGEVTLLWPEGLHELRLKERDMILVARDSRALALPLPYLVEEMSFRPTSVLALRVRKTVSQLEPRSSERTLR